MEMQVSSGVLHGVLNREVHEECCMECMLWCRGVSTSWDAWMQDGVQDMSQSENQVQDGILDKMQAQGCLMEC